MPSLDLPDDLSAPEPTPPTPPAPPADDVQTVRSLILAAYPDLVPELVIGDSVTALVASVEPARAAYARLRETLPVPPVNATPEVSPAIPAGGGAALAIDPDRLPTAEKIRRGLAGGRAGRRA